jgi:hypothetical protein
VGSDELLASYIARLEWLEDLEKDRALGFNNNDPNSSTPKLNPQGLILAWHLCLQMLIILHMV